MRLATCEQRRAVRARQSADLADDLPHRLGVAPVDALSGLQDGTAHDVLLEVLEKLERERGIAGVGEGLQDTNLCRVELVAAGLLRDLGIGAADIVPPAGLELRLDALVPLGLRWRLPRLLGGNLGKLDDR